LKWLRNNLPGLMLLGACGFLLLVSLGLSALWNRPPESGVDTEFEGFADPSAQNGGADLGPLSDYRIVSDQPLFNETRRPEMEALEPAQQEAAEEPRRQVAEAPKLTLTGVVMTPDMTLATLTPAGGGEPVMAHAGHPMTGEHQGWIISEIQPRKVTLESLDGAVVQLDLMVHDQKIKEPPRPVPAKPPEELAEDAGEQLSRAEEIRQRIAERREQLRQEAGESQPQNGPPPKSDYQAAIQRMINQSMNRPDEDDSDDGSN
jgi:hypothetical protein